MNKCQITCVIVCCFVFLGGCRKSAQQVQVRDGSEKKGGRKEGFDRGVINGVAFSGLKTFKPVNCTAVSKTIQVFYRPAQGDGVDEARMVPEFDVSIVFRREDGDCFVVASDSATRREIECANAIEIGKSYSVPKDILRLLSPEEEGRPGVSIEAGGPNR
jgi:hypothetical protein